MDSFFKLMENIYENGSFPFAERNFNEPHKTPFCCRVHVKDMFFMLA